MTTPGESVEDIPTEDAITRLRFRLDALKERVKQIWAAMHGDSSRGPDPDFTPWDDERRILIDIIRQKTNNAGGNNYNESGSSLLKWILGVLGLLLVSSIGSSVAVYGQFTALRAEVTEWKTSQQRQIDVASQRLDRLENRR